MPEILKNISQLYEQWSSQPPEQIITLKQAAVTSIFAWVRQAQFIVTYNPPTLKRTMPSSNYQ
jgi:hypothetical protein